MNKKNQVSMHFFLLLFMLVVTSPILANEISRLTEDRSYYSAELNKVKTRMFAYILDNKLATAAIIATGGGLGAFLEENMDRDTRNLVMLVGLIGIGYCFDNSENAKECASVTAELASYAAVINSYQAKINSLNSQISSPTRLQQADSSKRQSIRGSDKQGPEYHKESPNGVYIPDENQIKLIFAKNMIKLPRGQLPDITEAKKLAEMAESKLHLQSNDFYYTLLENNMLLVLKHESTFQDTEEFTGTGMRISKDEGEFLRVDSVLDGSPAHVSGVKSDDQILSINRINTKNIALDDASKLLKGEKSTKASLVIKRSTIEKPFSVEVERSLVKFQIPKNVLGYMCIFRSSEGRYYYLANDLSDWSILPIGEEKSYIWNVGKSHINIKAVRPNINADNNDREVNYSFNIK